MDDELRMLERCYAASRTKENKKRLNAARRRAGWTKEYVPCNGCNPATRTVRYGRSAMLCGKCTGDGWTHMEWIPPETADEDLGPRSIATVQKPPAR